MRIPVELRDAAAAFAKTANAVVTRQHAELAGFRKAAAAADARRPAVLDSLVRLGVVAPGDVKAAAAALADPVGQLDLIDRMGAKIAELAAEAAAGKAAGKTAQAAGQLGRPADRSVPAPAAGRYRESDLELLAAVREAGLAATA